MIRNILVEGPDCAGKSTLVKELKNHLGWDSLALTHKEGPQYERYVNYYAVSSQTIFERGHLSEVIYSELFDRPRPFSPRQLRILNWMLAENILVVLADAPDPLLLRRYHARSHTRQIVDPITLIQAAKAFRRWPQKLPKSTKIIGYSSTTYQSLEQLVKRLRQCIEADNDTNRP